MMTAKKKQLRRREFKETFWDNKVLSKILNPPIIRLHLHYPLFLSKTSPFSSISSTRHMYPYERKAAFFVPHLRSSLGPILLLSEKDRGMPFVQG